MSQDNKPREAGASALKQALSAARRGDLAAAEKWSKAAERMALAAEKLAGLPPAPDSWEDEEQLRAELRARLARVIDANRQQQQWEALAEAHAQASAHALAEGREPPAPLPFAPYPPAALEQILKGET